MRRLVVAVLIAAVSMLAPAAPSHAYPPSALGVTVDNVIPFPGQRITITVTGCTPGAALAFFIDPSEPMYLFNCAASGPTVQSVLAPIRIDVYVAELSEGARTASVTISVLQPTLPDLDGPTDDGGTGGDGLPHVGNGDTVPTTGIALGLTAMGAGLLAVARVRRRQTTVSQPAS